MPRSRLLALMCLIAIVAVALRFAWLTSDPPSDPTVGVVWHDEGAWVHSARNKSLWGHWRSDNWNPVFVAPVFTGLEYAAFSVFGVGTWQARTVPAMSGLLAVLALGWGVASFAGLRAGVLAAALLATNFFFVMWNRAALMESTMTSLIVASWAAYACAHARRPIWGAVAGVAAVLAFFTKAAAAFFVAALIVDAALTWLLAARPAMAAKWRVQPTSIESREAARWTLLGVVGAGAVVAVAFALPWWTEFRFYNWEMSVTRKPEYTLRAFLDRASWLPVVHDVFTRLWFVLVAAMAAMLAIVARWRSASPALRLLVLWVLIGFAELVVHDSGNERRYVMFVPALVALSAWVVAGGRGVRPGFDGGQTGVRPGSDHGQTPLWLLAPVVFFAAFLISGSAVRVLDLQSIHAHALSWTVRTSAVIAVVLGTIALWQWRAIGARLDALRGTAALAVALATLAIGSDVWQFSQWANRRTDLNYRASIEIGRLLPPGTLVHGKLANGLSLENRIRPIFVGREFGNYADRLSRSDVRYLLTYISPRLGYEGPVIVDVLEHLPDERILATFPVQETPDDDVAALIEKFPR